MHIENEQSKGRGRFVGKGNQIANNQIEHYEIVLTETEAGHYRFDIDQLPSKQLIRGQYWVIGDRMAFPKNWGKEKGAREMYRQLLEDAEAGYDSAKARLEKIKALGELIDSANWNNID